MPEGTPDEDAMYLALAALLMYRPERESEPPADELSALRRRHFEEHALSRSRHPSARRSA